MVDISLISYLYAFEERWQKRAWVMSVSIVDDGGLAR